MNYNEKPVFDNFVKRGFTVLTKGWPDLLVVDEKKNTAFAVEIKVDPDTVSPEQHEMHKWLNALGIPVYVCRNGKIHNWTGRKMVNMPVINQLKYNIDRAKTDLQIAWQEAKHRILEVEDELNRLERLFQETPETIEL